MARFAVWTSGCTLTHTEHCLNTQAVGAMMSTIRTLRRGLLSSGGLYRHINYVKERPWLTWEEKGDSSRQDRLSWKRWLLSWTNLGCWKWEGKHSGKQRHLEQSSVWYRLWEGSENSFAKFGQRLEMERKREEAGNLWLKEWKGLNSDSPIVCYILSFSFTCCPLLLSPNSIHLTLTLHPSIPTQSNANGMGVGLA